MQSRGYHYLFGATVVTLIALGSWWVVYFRHMVEVEQKAWNSELIYATGLSALMLGTRESPPQPGPLAGHAPLEIVPAALAAGDSLALLTAPRHPLWAVRPAPAALADIERRVGRRRLMVFGESGLLFVLLGLCTFMLYRYIRQQQAHGRRMESFVQAVTHEMKTPLTGLKSLLQTLAAGKVPQAQLERLLGMGLKETERLEHMVRNILISGSLKSEQYAVQPEAIALQSYLDGFLRHRRQLLAGRDDISLRLAFGAPADTRVRADGAALQVVLDNLTDNALKYGGTTVELAVSAPEGRVQIAVCDDGLGFAPELREELFVPFRRAMPGEHGVRHGTGLGLYIARALVRRMGGELRAHSDGQGRGSRFELELVAA